MHITVSHCRDCGRSMIARPIYERFPALREDHVCEGAHGMCVGCYCRAWRAGTGSDPAPPERRRKAAVQPCRDCGRPTISQRKYVPGQCSQYAERGAHGMCIACYMRARRHGTVPNPAPRTHGPTGQPCRDCGRTIRRPYVPPGGHGMCRACYLRAWRASTLPHPAPPRRAPRQPAESKRGQTGGSPQPDYTDQLDLDEVGLLVLGVARARPRHAQGEVSV